MKCNCKRKLTIVPELKNMYDENEDPLLIKTVHCVLFPELNKCKKLLIKTLQKMKSLEQEFENIKFLKSKNETLKS